MPPEDEQSDAAMDVFAAGVCLAALCLNKELLFEFDERESRHASTALIAHENDRAHRWRSFGIIEPPERACEFEAIVWQMLAYDRRKRITSGSSQSSICSRRSSSSNVRNGERALSRRSVK
jgi:serine/threonine protein kinase